MNRKKLFDISVAAGVVIALIICMCGFESGCENIKENVLRLHIIAASDSEYDQKMKLKVRDAVLEKGREIFSGSDTLFQAKQKIAENKDILVCTARDTLEKYGCRDDVKIRLCSDNFNTRVYDGFTLPAGKYEALEIIIGEGRGHNWWCVMFPPLCLPGCTGEITPEEILNEKGLDVLNSSPKYEIRFKVVEWIEKIRNKKSD
ncbi:MAG: stage II sporulation protein R [Clostridia bacterium]|nr:stage II sporulation protein R [Clostridia bacterium]